jgi:SPT2 chromatin protein
MNGGNDHGFDNSSSNVIRRRRLDNFTKIIILGTCIVLTLLNWLLLVRSNANVLISWLGMSCITIVLLKSYIVEEVTGGNGRMRRIDRLSAIVTILLFLTMALHLQSYANTQVAHGVIYSGPARIVGYDADNYESDAADGSTGGRGQQNANSEVVVTRTDLQVAWGGAWGCPNHVTTQCQALVQGALCEADPPEARKKKQRRLQLEQQRLHSRSFLLDDNSGPKSRRSSNRRGRRRLGGDDNNNSNADQKAAAADDTDNSDVEAKETEIQEEEEQVGKRGMLLCCRSSSIFGCSSMCTDIDALK